MKSLLLFMAGLFNGFLVEKCVAFGWHRFRFSPGLKIIRLLRVVITPSVTSKSTGRHYSLTFALIHAKSKTREISRNIVWKCLHDTELLYFFRL